MSEMGNRHGEFHEEKRRNMIRTGRTNGGRISQSGVSMVLNQHFRVVVDILYHSWYCSFVYTNSWHDCVKSPIDLDDLRLDCPWTLPAGRPSWP